MLTYLDFPLGVLREGDHEVVVVEVHRTSTAAWPGLDDGSQVEGVLLGGHVELDLVAALESAVAPERKLAATRCDVVEMLVVLVLDLEL